MNIYTESILEFELTQDLFVRVWYKGIITKEEKGEIFSAARLNDKQTELILATVLLNFEKVNAVQVSRQKISSLNYIEGVVLYKDWP